MIGRVIALSLAAPLLAATPVWAQDATASAPTDDAATALPASVDDLQPGGWAWDDSAPAKGPLSITVSLTDKRLYAYRGGALVGVSTVSTGRPGYETPTGDFTILEKATMHRSNKYNDAPMPFMERLTWDGVAIHAGATPDYATSHGCVHVPLAFAKKLFGETRTGVHVSITDDPVAATEIAATEGDLGQMAAPVDHGVKETAAANRASATGNLTLASLER